MHIDSLHIVSMIPEEIVSALSKKYGFKLNKIK